MPLILAHGTNTHVTTRNFLLAWEWDFLIAVPMFLAVSFYVVGWWRLNQSGYEQVATGWRFISYMSGQIVLAIALMSGIDIYQSSLFTVHMIQHELLMMIVPPLIWWGSPLPVILWGMPRPVRLIFGRLLNRRSRFRQGLAFVATPGRATMIYAAIIWLWHDPGAYNAALRSDLIHYIEHLSFFLAAMLFWWHITGAFPRLHSRVSYVRRIGLTILALISNQILSVGITLSESVIYEYYLTVPRINDMTAYDDQALGGVIMWVPGGMMYVLVIVFLVARLMEAGKPKRTKVGTSDE